MPVLHLNEVPGEVYERIQQRTALVHEQTVEAEAVCLLQRGLLAELAGRPQSALLAELRRRRFMPPSGTPDSVELLREDRER